MKFDPADIERLSELQQHELPKHLHPDVRRAVVTRMMEKSAGQPKSKKKIVLTPEQDKAITKLRKKAAKNPTVKRGAGGKIESIRRPIAPVGDETSAPKKDTRYAAPGAKPRKAKTTRSGKRIDKATGKIAVPLVKRGEGGRAVGTTPEERAAAVRTDLPSAGPEVMQPKPEVQTILPKGVLQRGGQRKLRGFSHPHSTVKAAVDAAVHHLGRMTETRGTPEFDDHEKAFDAIHGNIQNMDKHGLGITVGQLKHQTLTGGAKAPHILRLLHTRIQDRLEEGRMAEAENKQRAQEGRARKAGTQ